MPGNPETRFSRRFRKLLPSGGHQVRVENPAHPGTPDYNDCINGVEFWLEFKRVPKMPKMPNTPVFRDALRAEQVVWLYMRSRAKGRCFIVALVEDLDIIYIIPGIHAREFNSMTRSELDSLTVKLEDIWTATSSTGS